MLKITAFKEVKKGEKPLEQKQIGVALVQEGTDSVMVVLTDPDGYMLEGSEFLRITTDGTTGNEKLYIARIIYREKWSEYLSIDKADGRQQVRVY